MNNSLSYWSCNDVADLQDFAWKEDGPHLSRFG